MGRHQLLHSMICAQLNKPADAAALLKSLEHETVEVCQLLLLTTKHHVIGTLELSRGTLDSCTGSDLCQGLDHGPGAGKSTRGAAPVRGGSGLDGGRVRGRWGERCQGQTASTRRAGQGCQAAAV